MLKTGTLRHELVYQELTETATGSRGQSTATWTSVVTLKGSIRTLSGRELERARELVKEVTHEVVTHYHSDVDVKGRFLFGTRVFNIGHVNNIEERNRKLVILCTEGG